MCKSLAGWSPGRPECLVHPNDLAPIATPVEAHLRCIEDRQGTSEQRVTRGAAPRVCRSLVHWRQFKPPRQNPSGEGARKSPQGR
jgi:hypothetical protein